MAESATVALEHDPSCVHKCMICNRLQLLRSEQWCAGTRFKGLLSFRHITCSNLSIERLRNCLGWGCHMIQGNWTIWNVSISRWALGVVIFIPRQWCLFLLCTHRHCHLFCLSSAVRRPGMRAGALEFHYVTGAFGGRTLRLVGTHRNYLSAHVIAFR